MVPHHPSPTRERAARIPTGVRSWPMSAGTTLIGLDDVLAAREAIGTRLHRTPMFSSRQLGERIGGSVHLKAELFQRTGSFKIRGVLAKLATLSPEEKSRGVIGISAGNHAQALAYGAALEGIPSLVVMWQSASAQKIAATREYGATVDLSAGDPGEAFDRLDELIEETGMTLVHPFDDPYVIAGQERSGSRSSRTCPRSTRSSSPSAAAASSRGSRPRSRRQRADVKVDRCRARAARRRSTRASRPGQWVRVRPDSIADGLSAPFRGGALHRHRAGQGRRGPSSSRRTRSARGMRFLYQRSKLDCEAAGAVRDSRAAGPARSTSRSGSTVVFGGVEWGRGAANGLWYLGSQMKA